MAFDFKKFLNQVLYEEAPTPEEKSSIPTPEEMEAFETTMATTGGDDVTEMARTIIADSQVDSDNDEFPDISNVQNALETAGSGENHELIRRILVNYGGFDPADLEKDGVKRRQAIVDAITRVQQQDVALKASKADEEQSLTQAEKAAETSCTEAITQANVACEEAIEAEKQRSAAIIASIRQKAEDDTQAAKQARDETLAALAAQRSDNDAALRKSAALVAEVENQGNIVISKIDELLGYLS